MSKYILKVVQWKPEDVEMVVMSRVKAIIADLQMVVGAGRLTDASVKSYAAAKEKFEDLTSRFQISEAPAPAPVALNQTLEINELERLYARDDNRPKSA